MYFIRRVQYFGEIRYHHQTINRYDETLVFSNIVLGTFMREAATNISRISLKCFVLRDWISTSTYLRTSTIFYTTCKSKKSFRSSESRTDFSWYIAEEINKNDRRMKKYCSL